jgi:hypothetical protein
MNAIFKNLALLIGWWILSFAAVQLLERSGGAGVLSEASIVVVLAIAAGLAVKLRAMPALFCFALFGAWKAALLVGHLTYGIYRVNGGPVQATIGLAATFGFAAGALVMMPYFRRLKSQIA